MSDLKEATMDDPKETLCLDFSNVVGRDVSSVRNYDDLAVWAQQEGVISAKKASHLQRAAAAQPDLATRTYRKAVALHKAIHGIFSAIAAGTPTDEKDLQRLSKASLDGFKHLRMAKVGTGYEWKWSDAETALELPLWIVARSASDLLTSKALSRIRQCQSANCDWLFLDRSKNSSRKWCDMGDCGNREKARRSRARKQEKA